MQPQTATEANHTPNAIKELYALLTNPVALPVAKVQQDLAAKGFTDEEINMMLEIGTQLTDAQQKLAAYSNEQNKQILEKNLDVPL